MRETVTDEEVIYNWILHKKMNETERNSFLNWMYCTQDSRTIEPSLDTFLNIINNAIKYDIVTRELLLGFDLSKLSEDDFNLSPELFKNIYENM